MSAPAFLVFFALAQAAPAAAPSAEPTPRPLPAGPVVAVETSLGSFKIGLHKDKAPISVENFLNYVRAKHYDGTLFHRVIPGFMIQGGGYDAQMVQRPTRPSIRNEAGNGLRNSRGSVAMARLNAPNSATAQFFVNLKDNASLDFGIRGAGYAVFGEVIEGMDVVDMIAGVPTTTKSVTIEGARVPFADFPIAPVVIKSIRAVAAPAAVPPKPAATPGPQARR